MRKSKHRRGELARGCEERVLAMGLEICCGPKTWRKKMNLHDSFLHPTGTFTSAPASYPQLQELLGPAGERGQGGTGWLEGKSWARTQPAAMENSMGKDKQDPSGKPGPHPHPGLPHLIFSAS